MPLAGGPSCSDSSFAWRRVLKLKKQRLRLAEQQQMLARTVLDAARSDVAAIGEQIARGAAALAEGLAGAARDGSWLAQHEQALRMDQSSIWQRAGLARPM